MRICNSSVYTRYHLLYLLLLRGEDGVEQLEERKIDIDPLEDVIQATST